MTPHSSFPVKIRSLIIAAFTLATMATSCNSARYLTDEQSIKTQRELCQNRSAINVADVLFGMVGTAINQTGYTDFQVGPSPRSFRKIRLRNTSQDTLIINMFAGDIWNNRDYCDITGLVLPPGKRKKLIVPYPSVYNIYFRSTYEEEDELIEVNTGQLKRETALYPGLTYINTEADTPEDN